MSRFADRIRHQFSDAGSAKRAGLILLVLAAFSVVGTSAWAFWTTFGSGSASATTGTLNVPTNVTVPGTSTGTVLVSWTGSTLSNSTPAQGYYVTRIKNSDSSTAAACASSAGSLIAGPSCSDLAVPDGTFHYTVTAVYLSWSATSGASGDVTVTSSIATTTTVSSSLNPSVVGQSVMYTATVTPHSGSTTPTGLVTFKDNGTTITCTSGTQTLNGSGVATCQFTYSSVGTHSITAVYTGAGSFTTSTSTSLAQAVNQASTTTSVSSTPNPSVVGQSVTYTATVAVSAPGAGTPTGNVEFFDGGTPIATCGGATGNPLSVTTATCSQTYATVSSHTITAQYLGSTNFNASAASASLTQAVNKASTTTSVSSTPNPSVVGQSVTYTATVAVSAPGAGTPTGTVTFKDGTSTITCTSGTPALNGSGVATCTLASAGVGAHSITGVYGADANYLTSTSTAFTQTVNQASTTTSVSSTPNPSVVGQSVTYTATVAVNAPGAGTPTGTVTFKDGTSTITCTSGTPALNGSGVATCTLASTTVGAHSITGVYSGDTNFLTSTSTAFTQTVNQASTTTSVSSTPNPSVVGQSVTYTATVAVNAPGAGTPTGTVTFKDGLSTIACTGGSTTLSLGLATCQIAYTGVGTHSITTVYGSDTNFLTSTSSPAITQTVSQASTSTALTSSVNPSVVGQSVTFTATVAVNAPGAGTPTGNVEFFDGGTPIGTCGGVTGSPLSGTTATCSVSYPTVSSHTITAQYLGSTDFNASAASASLTQTVSTSLAIAAVFNDHGKIKVYFTGTGAAAYTAITVTICALNSFPCANSISVSTAGNPPAGNWTSGTSSKNLDEGTTYYAQAVQGTTSSAVFSFSPPP